MKIPQGYKQTEIGIIPKDWVVTTIGDIGLIVGGGTPSTAVDAYWNGNIQWFTPAEITDVAKYISKSFRTISDLGLSNSSAKLLPKGTILLTTRASIGQSAILLNEATTNQGFQSIIVNSENNNEFIYYLLKTKVDEMRNLASGSTFLEISNKKLSSISIAIPPIEEQRRIAEVLSDMDGLIAALDKKIAKKKLIKHGAMQQLLANKHGNKHSIGEIVSIKKGEMLTSDEFIYGPIPVIAGGRTLAGYHNVANRPARTITISASGANAGFVAFHDYPIFATDCSTISPNDDFDIKYIYYLLQYHQSDLYATQTGGAQPHVHPKDVEGIKISYIDSIKKQQAIATILSDMDKEISDLERKRDKYKLLKNGMMQKLLTGQIRLN